MFMTALKKTVATKNCVCDFVYVESLFAIFYAFYRLNVELVSLRMSDHETKDLIVLYSS